MTQAILSRLESINQASLIRTLTDAEHEFLFAALRHSHPKVFTGAALLLSETDNKEILERLFKEFKTCSRAVKKLLIPFFSTASIMEPYRFLLDFLEKSKDSQLNTIICDSLPKAEYFFFPLILPRLDSDNKLYIINLKKIIGRIGFRKIEPFLAMMIQIPHEIIFREIFGDDLIDQLKSD